MIARKIDLFDEKGQLRTFDDIEREVLRTVYRHCGLSMTTTEKVLGVGRSTLYRKLDETQRAIAKAGI